MEYLDIDESPDLAEAQVTELANIVDIGEDGKPPFYVAISQTLDNDTGWLSTAPRPLASGTDIEDILEDVWASFNARRACPSPYTMRWHVYRIEGRCSWGVQTFEVFRYNADLLDFEKWCQEVDDRNAAIEKEENVQERRGAMKVVGREGS